MFRLLNYLTPWQAKPTFHQFNNLPAEIRREILRLVFMDCWFVEDNWPGSYITYDIFMKSWKYIDIPRIMLVSHQWQAEMEEAIFSKFIFKLKPKKGNQPPYTDELPPPVPLRLMAQVRKINFHVTLKELRDPEKVASLVEAYEDTLPRFPELKAVRIIIKPPMIKAGRGEVDQYILRTKETEFCDALRRLAEPFQVVESFEMVPFIEEFPWLKPFRERTEDDSYVGIPYEILVGRYRFGASTTVET